MLPLVFASVTATALSSEQHTFQGQASTHQVFEQRLAGGDHENPFTVACTARVTGPSASKRASMDIPLFYDGDNEWAFRFSPDVAGAWTWSTSCAGPQYQGCYKEDPSDRDLAVRATSGSIGDCQSNCAGYAFFGMHWTRECWCGDSFGKHGTSNDCLCSSDQMEDSANAGRRNCVYSTAGVTDAGLVGQHGTVEVSVGSGHGGLIQHPLYKQQYAYEDGSDYLLVGLEADWFWAPSLKGEDWLESFLDHLKSFGFNHFLVQTFSDHAGWNDDMPDWTPPKYSPSQPKPWASEDQTRLDLNYFQNFDRFLAHMSERDLIAHLMLYVGNKNVQWPAQGSLADEIYWRNCLARFGAFSSVLWDVSKEAGSYGVGNDYVLDRLQYINDMNPHARLVTAHSGLSWNNRCSADGSAEGSLCTMMTRQAHASDEGHVLDQESHFYQDMIHALNQDPDIPVANLEFFYEAGDLRACQGSCCNGCATTEDEVHAMRRVMWDLYMAGGSGAWYNCDVSWDVIVPTTNSTGFGYVKHLSDFWNRVKFNGMQRSNDMIQTSSSSTVRCIAGNEEVVVHSRDGAEFSVNVASDSVKEASWFEPASGRSESAVASGTAPQYLGCFYENTADRDLPDRHGNGDVEYCRDQCAGYKYFGQHWTQECWCGNSFGKHGAADECECSAAQMDTDRNCVYSVDATVPSYKPPSSFDDDAILHLKTASSVIV